MVVNSSEMRGIDIEQLLNTADLLGLKIFIISELNQILYYSNTVSSELTQEQIQDISENILDLQSNNKVQNYFKLEIKSETFLLKLRKLHNGLSILTLISLNEIPIIENEIMKTDSVIEDLEAIFESSWDVIYVVDANGKTLRISSACEKILGYPAEKFINRSVFELEKEQVFWPSIARLVMEKKQSVSRIQLTRTGKRLFTTGTPVFNKKGELIRIVNTARDITEKTKMQDEIEIYKNIIKKYEGELDKLRIHKSPFLLKSKEMKNVYDLSKKVSNIPSTLLITGETGVGKSFLARYIHEQSDRKDAPFITINCGVIPEKLLESELFGYSAGAFTDAKKQGKKGLVSMAEKGVLFLDEIGDIPYNLQVKLLQLIQEKTYIPVGSTKIIKADIRIIAATNQNLEELVAEKKFRKDLFYRLSVIPIHLPPLRERNEDIIPLLYKFIDKFKGIYGKKITLSNEAINTLTNYHWPGNIRELENVIERIVVTSTSDFITNQDVPDFIIEHPTSYGLINSNDMYGGTLKDVVEHAEREYLIRMSEIYTNTTEMAIKLNVNQSTISRKLKKYNIKLK